MANKVYTKKGDDGTTSLLSGRRVPKTIQEIKAVGSLDELNSFIGLLRSEILDVHGIFETINRLVSNKKKLSQGFSEMVDSGDGENTLEKIVLDYPDLFPEETVTAAKEKLKSI